MSFILLHKLSTYRDLWSMYGVFIWELHRVVVIYCHMLIELQFNRLSLMYYKFGIIVLFWFYLWLNQVYRACILKQIESNIKRGDSNCKINRNEANWNEWFDMICYKWPKMPTIWQYSTLKKVFVSYAKRLGLPVSIRFGYRITKQILALRNSAIGKHLFEF